MPVFSIAGICTAFARTTARAGSMYETLRVCFSIAAAAAIIVLSGFIPGAARAAGVPVPTVEGPITGPGDFQPAHRALPAGTNPADFGYIQEEFFISGTAAGQPYKTRILVTRPPTPSQFSGVVAGEVMHSSGNSLLFQFMRESLMLRGHIHVDIDAQKANVDTTLKGFNAARYASLNIPSAGQVNEIIAQAGALLKSNAAGSPLAGYRVRAITLMGTSQSSGVVRSYLPTSLSLRMADGSSVYDGFFLTSTLGNTPLPVVDVPMVQMPTQTEVTSAANTGAVGYRRPDSDDPANRFRIYEVAAQSHNDSRENALYDPNPCTKPLSDFPVGATSAMGYNHLVRWITRGIVPPHAQYMQTDFNTANDGSPLALDRFGNATGGVRNTYVDVPAATYGVPQVGNTTADNFNCSLVAWRIPLPHSTMRELYGNEGEYVEAVARRLRQLIKEGWFLPEYAGQVLSDAYKPIFAPLQHGRRDSNDPYGFFDPLEDDR